MNEITTSKFDYSSLDINTADYLKQKENNMREIVSGAYYEIGKELKEAQERLAGDNQYNGVFQKWYENLGFKRTTVYNYMNYYELVVQNLEDRKHIESLPRSLVYEIAKPSADPELKQQVLDGDVTSHKEYQKLKKEKEELEERLEFIKKINEEAVKERREISEKLKIQMDRSEDKIEEYESKIEFLENNPIVPDEIESRLKELEERAGDLAKHKSEVKNYKKKQDELYEEINRLQEYKRKLEEENSVIAQRAEVVQGIRTEISKLRKGQGKIEQLLKKDIQLRDVDLYNINEMADFLNEMAEKLYDYIASQKSMQKGEIVDV